MNDSLPSYGLWSLVVINAAMFVIFAFSFTKPRTARDWRSFGAFSAFLVALFTEMYGFPLTIYLLSGWLGRRFPGMDLFTHTMGHLWQVLLGWNGDPHADAMHIASNVFIAVGFILLGAAWKRLYAAQCDGHVALGGPYAYVRHTQYVAFVLIMVGFLLQWPTIITLIMFPILVTIYVRLARREEREALALFGAPYRQYMEQTSAFWPRFGPRPAAMSR